MISRVCYCFRPSRVCYSLYCNKLSVHNRHKPYKKAFRITKGNNSNRIGPLLKVCLVYMNMFARFDEIPTMTLQDIKETKLYRHTCMPFRITKGNNTYSIGPWPFLFY